MTNASAGAPPVLPARWTEMMHEGEIGGRERLERATRVDTVYGLTVGYPGGSVDAELINLSSEGFRLRCNEPLETGWSVTLKAGCDNPLRAVIVWASGLDAGGVFAEPVAL